MSSPLETKAAQFEADVNLLHQVVHGDAETIVQTNGGPVRSVAGTLQSIEAELSAGAVVNAAQAARLAAESARDIAQSISGIRPDIGSAEDVPDGEYFYLPSDDAAEALALYRKISGIAVDTGKRLPSAQAFTAREDIIRQQAERGNRFTRDQLMMTVLPDYIVSPSCVASQSLGIRTMLFTAPPGNWSRGLWRFQRADFAGDVVAASMVIERADPGGTGSRFRLYFRNAAGGQIGFAASASTNFEHSVSTATVVKIENAVIPDGCAFIDFDLQVGAPAGAERKFYIRGMFIGARPKADFVWPDEIPLINKRVDDVISNLAAASGRTTHIEAQIASGVSGRMSYVGNLSKLPADFPPIPVLLRQDFYSQSVTLEWHDEDLAATDASRLELFVDPVAGSDANTGLSPSSAKRSIPAAFSAAQVVASSVVVNLADGIYYRDTSVGASSGINNSQHITVRAANRAIITSALAPTETAWENVAPGVWSTPATAVSDVFDAALLDYRGIPLRYRKMPSVAEVVGSPGGWVEVGGVVYVHTVDCRAPDPDLLVNINQSSMFLYPNAGKTVRIENIGVLLHKSGMHGLLCSTTEGGCGYLQIIKSWFAGAAANGLSTRRVTLSVAHLSTAAYNGADGFNYHNAYANPELYRDCAAIESGCHSYSNGVMGGAGNSNASSAHEGMSVIRINGLYYDSHGPVVADVNGCNSLAVNCIAAKSTRSDGVSKASWYFDNALASSHGRTWLIGCGSHDSMYDISTDAGYEIFVRGWQGKPPILGPTTLLIDI